VQASPAHACQPASTAAAPASPPTSAMLALTGMPRRVQSSVNASRDAPAGRCGQLRRGTRTRWSWSAPQPGRPAGAAAWATNEKHRAPVGSAARRSARRSRWRRRCAEHERECDHHDQRATPETLREPGSTRRSYVTPARSVGAAVPPVQSTGRVTGLGAAALPRRRSPRCATLALAAL